MQPSSRTCGGGIWRSAAIPVKSGILDRLEEEAKERQRQGKTKVSDPGQARTKAAAMFLTNRQYISDAKRIGGRDPVLLDALVDGSITIRDAMRRTSFASSLRLVSGLQ